MKHNSIRTFAAAGVAALSLSALAEVNLWQVFPGLAEQPFADMRFRALALAVSALSSLTAAPTAPQTFCNPITPTTRLVVVGAPKGLVPALGEFTVFGKGLLTTRLVNDKGPMPDVDGLTVKRMK